MTDEPSKRVRDWMSWAFPYLGTALLTIIFMLSCYTLARVVALGEGQAAQVERDKGQDALIANQSALLAALTALVDTMRNRQADRIPIFDRLVTEVDDHEKRIQQIERGRRSQ